MSGSDSNKSQIVLGYWAIRGLAEPIRLALYYTKTPFNDKFYVQGEGPEFSRQEWLSEKPNIGLDFPNLPYMFYDDLKLTQSKAILYFLGRKFNLLGKNVNEEANVMMLCEEAHDLRMGLNGVFYGASVPSANDKKQFLESFVSKYFQNFDNYLGKNNTKFAVGDQPTVADFQLYEYLDTALALDEEGNFVEKYPNVKRLLTTVRELPELKDYIAKARRELPLNNKVAKFGGKVVEQK